MALLKFCAGGSTDLDPSVQSLECAISCTVRLQSIVKDIDMSTRSLPIKYTDLMLAGRPYELDPCKLRVYVVAICMLSDDNESSEGMA